MSKKPKSQPPRNEDAIAIIGMGALFPEAENLGEFWGNLLAGRDSIKDIPASHWRPEDYFANDPKSPDMTYGRKGGFLPEYPFDPLRFGLSPQAIEATDTSQLFGMIVAHEAMKDAGYGPEAAFDRDRVSCILGITGALELVIPLGARLGHPKWRQALRDAGVPDETAADVMARISASYVGWQEASFPGLLGNVVAGRVANALDLGGTNTVCDSACGSSLAAVTTAVRELRTGACDMAITGGVDTFNDIFMYMCFSKTPALSPGGHARPYDAQGDGTTLGEGVGMVVLKRLADAEASGDRIYAVIKGVGSSSDGKGKAIYAPASSGQAKAVARCYADAGVSAASITLVEGHGTGTKVGDGVEIEGLKSVFADAAAVSPPKPWCGLGSVKSQVGHTKAAAGAAGLIKAAMALYYQTLPPTIKADTDHPALAASPFYLNKRARPWPLGPDGVRRAGVSAFGFGGSNFHCLLESYPQKAPPNPAVAGTEIMVFTDKTPEALHGQLAAFNMPGRWRDLVAVAADQRASWQQLVRAGRATGKAVAFLVVQRWGRPASEQRALLLGRLGAKLTDPVSAEGFAWQPRWQPHQGKVAVLFPGQGSQYPGMMAELLTAFPHLQTHLWALRSQLAAGFDLNDILYPAALGPSKAQQAALTLTDRAQPALAAVSMAAYELLNEGFGLQAAMTGGHSFGELMALWAAGRLPTAAVYDLAVLRGSLMAQAAPDLGGMLAVMAPRDEVAALVAQRELALVVANHNAPQQVVLAGDEAALTQGEAACREAGLRFMRLPVGAAFHSPLVAAAAEPFAAAVADSPWQDGALPVYSNTSGQAYPQKAAAAQKLLGHQLARPVQFVAQVEAMVAAGADIFVEVGPSRALTGLVNKIAGERAVAVPLDSKGHGALASLAQCLVSLMARGVAVDLAAWPSAAYYRRDIWDEQPKFTVPICGANKFKAPQLPPAKAVARQKNTNQPPLAPQTSLVPPPTQSRVAPHSPAMASRPVAQLPVAALGGVSQQQALSTRKESIPVDQSQSGTKPSAARSLFEESLLALQELQLHNAKLHEKYLDGQRHAQDTFARLLEASLQQEGQGTFALPRPAPTTRVTQPVVTPVAAAKTAVVQAPQAHPRGLQPPGQPIFPAPPVAERDPARSLGAQELRAGTASQAPQPGAATDSGQANQDGLAAVLAVIADKTGYPVDMITPGMHLEADLGIDSIKRVEIFAVLQERLPTLAGHAPEALNNLQTVGAIADLVTSSTPAVAGARATPQVVATAAPAATGTSNPGAVQKTVFAIIAEKTGYPEDMLQADMALEADLGIDSIKRVEIFSQIAEAFPSLDAQVFSAEQSAALQTLAQVVQKVAGASSQAANPGQTAEPEAAAAAGAGLAGSLAAVIAAKTGYPRDMIKDDMSWEADLGVDSIKKVEILSALKDEHPELAALDNEGLNRAQTIQEVVALVKKPRAPHQPTLMAEPKTKATVSEATEGLIRPEASTAAPLKRIVVRSQPVPKGHRQQAINLGPKATVWVAGDGSAIGKNLQQLLQDHGFKVRLVKTSQASKLKAPKSLAGLVLLAPESQKVQDHEDFLLDSFALMQLCRPGLLHAAAGDGAVLMAVSRNGGNFGLDGVDHKPYCFSGGIAGLVKTASHEWPDVHCKSVDLSQAFLSAEMAAASLWEEFSHTGLLEVGLNPDGPQTPGLVKRELAAENLRDTPPWEPGDLVVVTGGARGITGAISVGLGRWQPRLLLLGRSPLPEPEPAWAEGLTDEKALKKALFEAFGAEGPQGIQRRYQQLMKDRELRQTFAALDQQGVPYSYKDVDVRDAAAVAACLAASQKEFGPVRGIIHGAGVIYDRLLADKTREQFLAVYETKVHGLLHILAALDLEQLRVLALFSSSTGRYGRRGQGDYAVANEVLNKLAQYVKTQNPQCRSVALGWGPWDGGMVDPGLKRVFAQEGVGCIPLAQGRDHCLQELLVAPQSEVEVVVMAEPYESLKWQEPSKAMPPHNQRLFADLPLVFEQLLSVALVPILKDHEINGRCVVPAALALEWLGHAALVTRPGAHFAGVQGFQVLHGIKLNPQEEVRLSYHVGAPIMGVGLPVLATMVTAASQRPVPVYRGMVVLTEQGTAAEPRVTPAATINPEVDLYQKTPEDIYRGALFHGKDLQAIHTIKGMSSMGLTALIDARKLGAAKPHRWCLEPLRSEWLTAPLLLDAAFQLMVLWSVEHWGQPSLPLGVADFAWMAPGYQGGPVEVRISITRSGNPKVTCDMEFLNGDGGIIGRIKGYEGVATAPFALPQGGDAVSRIEV